MIVTQECKVSPASEVSIKLISKNGRKFISSKGDRAHVAELVERLVHRCCHRQRIHYQGLCFMEPKQLSQELLQGKDPNMSRRRAIVGLSLLGGSMGQIVTLYQTGIVGHLPDPPGQQLFDADRVMHLTTLTAASTHQMDR